MHQVMHQSIPEVTIPPGNYRVFAHVVSPEVGYSQFYSGPRAQDISVPQGDPQAFDIQLHNFESWMSLSGRTRPILACLSGTRKTCRRFQRYVFSILDISSYKAYKYKQQGELYFVYHKTITDMNTA